MLATLHFTINHNMQSHPPWCNEIFNQTREGGIPPSLIKQIIFSCTQVKSECVLIHLIIMYAFVLQKIMISGCSGFRSLIREYFRTISPSVLILLRDKATPSQNCFGSVANKQWDNLNLRSQGRGYSSLYSNDSPQHIYPWLIGTCLLLLVC